MVFAKNYIMIHFVLEAYLVCEFVRQVLVKHWHLKVVLSSALLFFFNKLNL